MCYRSLSTWVLLSLFELGLKVNEQHRPGRVGLRSLLGSSQYHLSPLFFCPHAVWRSLELKSACNPSAIVPVTLRVIGSLRNNVWHRIWIEERYEK